MYFCDKFVVFFIIIKESEQYKAKTLEFFFFLLYNRTIIKVKERERKEG